VDVNRLYLLYVYPPANYHRRLPTNDELINSDMRRDFARYEAGFVNRTQATGPSVHDLFGMTPALSGDVKPPEQWTGKVVETES
jgi:hypothetical protein